MPLAAGSRLGQYEIIAPLGKGGMGEVYRAADPRLRREVAIKLLAPDGRLSPEMIQRFEREARAASALNHPNIVGIYDIGSQDGDPYIVMELVEGESLRSLLRRGPLSVRKYLDIAVQVADGLAAAHQAGITHRDVKPENIMIGRDGRVKILDFGLALQAPPVAPDPTGATLTAGQTLAGSVLGTLYYMSPEQARGEPVDYRSDQFSFGVVLHEMVSGVRPFERKSVAETLQAILSAEPPPIPDNASVPETVRWIISRCLAKETGERYGSTADLYRDLRAHRDHLVVTGTTVRVRRFASRRLRWAVAALACFSAGALSVWLTQPRTPDLGAYHYTPFAADSGMDAAPVWSPDGTTIAYLREIGGVAQVVTRRVAGGTTAQITRSPVSCRSVTWSPDGSRIYYVAGLRLWSVGAAGGPSQAILNDVGLAALSPDGRTVAIGRSGPEGKLWLHSLETGRTEPYPAPLAGQSMNRHVRFSPDGSTIGAFWPSQREHAVDSTFWMLPFPPGPPARSMVLEASAFAWMPDSRRLVAAMHSPHTGRRHLYLVDTRTGEREPLTAGLANAGPMDVSPDGTRIAFTNGGVDSDLVEVPLDGSTVREVLATSGNETNPSWSPDGASLAYVQDSHDGGTRIWLRTVDGSWSRPLHEPGPPGSTFTNPRFSPDGRRIVYEMWSQEGYTVWVTAVSGGAPVRLTTERDHMHSPAWSPDGNWIAYRANIGDRRLLEKAPSGGGRPITLAQTVSASGISWSPTGDWILYSDGLGLRLTPAAGGESRDLTDRPSASFGFSRDGRRVYFTRSDGARWALWSVQVPSGLARKERSLDVPASAALRGFSLHPDGTRFLASVEISREDVWILSGFAERRARLPWFARSN
jgi:serine/threonine protein kinase/WD40 repeat protein